MEIGRPTSWGGRTAEWGRCGRLGVGRGGIRPFSLAFAEVQLERLRRIRPIGAAGAGQLAERVHATVVAAIKLRVRPIQLFDLIDLIADLEAAVAIGFVITQADSLQVLEIVKPNSIQIARAVFQGPIQLLQVLDIPSVEISVLQPVAQPIEPVELT